jgi:hypothetical protein
MSQIIDIIDLRGQIAPKNLTPEVQMVLGFIGNRVHVMKEYDDDDDLVYALVEQRTSLLVMGDDSWGAVTGAFVKDGHLILIANFGDDGEYSFCLTGEGANQIGLNQICASTLLSDVPVGGKVVTLALSPAIAEKHPQLMSDILCIAVEGGISYWAEGKDFVRDADLNYVSCKLRPSRDEGLPYEKGDPRNDWKHVDAGVIEAAVLRVINENLCSSGIREWILSDYLDPNSSSIDAEAADVIVQIALFGEVVFG